jgi:hypothetical protein
MRTKMVTVLFFEFVLVALHPQKGRYVFCNSLPMRDIFVDHYDGDWGRVSHTYFMQMLGSDVYCDSTWYVELARERIAAWQQFNDKLIEGAWLGITEDAKKREQPDRYSYRSYAVERVASKILV